MKNIPLDAIPDLSDVQVIIYTEWPGQAPQIVQDQVTYPITTKMLSVPNAKVVRGYSFYGFSFVYVIFEDGTDPYWARSRVLEYLSGYPPGCPRRVARRSARTPPASAGRSCIRSIRRTQPRRIALDAGLVSQVSARLRGRRVRSRVRRRLREAIPGHRGSDEAPRLQPLDRRGQPAIERNNGEVGGRSIEMAEKEFILRVRGYIQNLEDLQKVAVGVGAEGVPILLGEVANVQFGPDMRRGIAELNGEGETVGGIVVVRYGANARQVIHDVKKRLDAGDEGAAAGRQVYDRLRPHGADRPRGEDAGREAAGGKRRRRAGVHPLPAPPPQRARRHHHPAGRGADFVPGDGSARASAPTSCPSAASPSPSARWWTRSSS